jgi:hypothetical protein
MRTRLLTSKIAGVLTALGLVMGLASPAWADHEDSEQTTIIFAPGLLLTTTTTTGVVAASSPMITTSSTTSSTSDALDVNGCRCRALSAYIDQNGAAMEQDIAMGGGQSVADLAALLALPDDARAAFGKALRRNKGAFTAILRAEGMTSQERGVAFARALRAAFEADKQLAALL